MPILSKPYQAAYRGVMSSSELNAWMANLHADLSEMFARVSLHDEAIPAQNALWLIQHAYLRAEVESLRAQLKTLQQGPNTDRLLYLGADTWVTASPDGNRPACTVDTDLGILTAHVDSETSKLYVKDLTGEIRVPKSLTYRLYERPGDASGSFPTGAVDEAQWIPVQAQDLGRALDGRPETAFFRAPSLDGTALSVLLELALPSNVVSHRRLNKVAIYPAPTFAYDWAYAAASADSGASFGWLDPVGGGMGSWVPEARKVGPFALFVPERTATHLRVGLVIRRFLISGTTKLFPYGFRHLEASYVRFHEGESRLRLVVAKPDPSGTNWYLTQDPEPDFYPGAEALAGQVGFELYDATGAPLTPGGGNFIGPELRLVLILKSEANESPVLRGVKLHYQVA